MTIHLRKLGIAALMVGAAALACSQRAEPGNSSSALPFQPQAIFEGSNLTITNPESDPYVDTSLRIYVGSTLFTASIGTLAPGESKAISWERLLSENGEQFRPGQPRTSDLEVRARFRGNDDHKDFPPPK